MDDLLKFIKEDADLQNELMELWKKDASTEKIESLFARKGYQIKEQQVEILLSEFQKSKAKELASKELDENMLANAAGSDDGESDGTGIGCTQADDCDDHYKTCGRAFHSNQCYFTHFCDEAFTTNPVN